MNFFWTEKDFDEWTQEMELDESDIFKLPVRDAVEVARELFDFR